jgi:hypothetical protein
MPEFDPYDLASREKQSYRLVNTPDPGDTAVAVVNPDGSLIGSGGGGSGNVNLIEVGGSPIALGQTTESASLPVVLASNQSTVPVSASSLPLPTGASTSANQATMISDLGSILANQTNGTQETIVTNFPATQPVSGTVAVSNFPATQPVSGTVTANAGTGTFAVSAASLPLPTGASTSANQTTELASLASILANQTNGTQETQVTNFPASQVVKQNATRGNFVDNNINLSTTTETTILPAAVSNFHDITSLVITNNSTSQVTVTLRDGTGGTVRMNIDLAPLGGITKDFPNPLEQAAINSNWTLELSAAVSSVNAFAQAVIH